jgi:hypothetical protein
MSRGQHAAGDGSFGRSAGGAMARGIALIVAAVVLGIVLLNATDRTPSFTESAGSKATATTVAGSTESTTASTPDTTKSKAHDPSAVSILVANGSGVKGAAAKIATTLAGSNYVLKTSVNTKTAASSSVVYYAPGYDADARAIASLLTPAPAVQPMPDPLPVADLASANILVVIAADIAAGH